MVFKTVSWFIILFTIFLYAPFSFSGEIFRWTDEWGTIHFTDDVSKIPEKYSNQADRIEVPEEIYKESDKPLQPRERPDRVEEYLKNLEKRIEAKKKVEIRISELEEELRRSEEMLKRIEEYEKEYYLYYQPFKDPKTGKWIILASPYYEEKKRLKNRMESIKAELRLLYQKLSEIIRGL